MRKKIITVAATLLLLGLLSMVEQLSVERLTSEAMEKTQEILFLLAQNEPEQGLERARRVDRGSYLSGGSALHQIFFPPDGPFRRGTFLL